ncbi:MAG: hypothetical protein EPN91_08125 [Salinibacterium sp.]|nr:MAG: hypothetical protein EPN91_08125 [Salinibacterium sp.]
MRIAVICGFDCGNGTGWWGKPPPNVLELEDGPTVGGGEEAAIRAAVGLRELGHSVDCWWYGRDGEWRGVPFHSLQADLYYALCSQPWDAVVSFSSLRPLEWAPKGAVRIYAQQLNDLLQRGAWDRVDCIVSPSESHAQQLPTWGWRGRPYAVVHNGLDAELYGKWTNDDYTRGYKKNDTVPPPWKERPLNVGYWSSPDRGLHHLLRAWPKVVKKVPEARLHVFYEIDRYLPMAVQAPGLFGDRGRHLNCIIPEAKADPSIIFHGAVSRARLRKTQFITRVHCYPLMPIYYTEGFGTSLACGIAAGCHVMTTPRDAFPSLYGGAVTWLPPNPTELDAVLPDFIVRGLTDEEWSLEQVCKAEPHRFNYTWERAAKEMEAACMKKNWQLTTREESAEEFVR